MITIRASCPRALAISTICILATLKLRIGRSIGSSTCKSANRRLASARNRLPIDPAREPPARFAAQEQVFGDGHVRNRHQFLVDHGDAVPHGLSGTAEA